MAFFAVQVNTGEELQAKENLLKSLSCSEYEEVNYVKAIYTMQKHTTFIDSHDEVSENLDEEKENHYQVVKKSIGNRLGNLKKQYEELKHKRDSKSVELKHNLKHKINQLYNEQQTYKTNTTTKSLLPGYMLIELNTDIEYMPSNLYHLIKSSPLIQEILSNISVPKSEIEWMFELAEESQVEIQFEEVMDNQEMETKEKEAVYQSNIASHPEEKKSYIKEYEQEAENLVSKVNNVKNKFEDTINQIKGFIKRKKETVRMNVSLFKEIYPETRKSEVLPALSFKEFINRLDRLLTKKKVALE